jgi:hypothetical protein
VLLLLAVARPEAAMATEEPKYRVEKDYGEFEVRLYAPVIVAETEVTGEFGKVSNEGFRRLAGYIFGGNDGGRKIAMTAPVGTEPAPGKTAGTKIDMTAPVGAQPKGEGWVVSFTMPSRWTMKSLPVPDDDRIRLREVPARRIAAVRFSGTWGAEKFEAIAAQLREQLEKQGLVPADAPPVYARYNPPWTPWFLRRNEVLVPLR